jgi:hypothetical protein
MLDQYEARPGKHPTWDQERVSAIEARVRATFKDGAGAISEEDFNTLMASWLAWKMTAKCFAAETPSSQEK